MYNIKIDENFKKLCITFRGAMILAKIKNTESSEALWEEIKQEENKLLASYTTESIKGRSGIAATRQAYKQFGKDPSVIGLLANNWLVECYKVKDCIMSTRWWTYSISYHSRQAIQRLRLMQPHIVGQQHYIGHRTCWRAV